MFIDISNNLKKLSKYFPENLYVVGGYVRNKILAIPTNDVDITSSVNAEEVAKRLSDSEFSVKVKNIKLGSIIISKDDESYEYTAFRKETYDNGGHFPKTVEWTENLEEDALRRDFTINAIYYNINKDVCIDKFQGIIDLKQKLVRQTSETTLQYDGERILRMVRIAGELDFDIDKATLKNAKMNAKNISEISGTRKAMEIEKILYCEQKYGKKSNLKAMRLLNVLGAWKYLGLFYDKINYKMCARAEDRFLGLLIDIVDTQKPECLEAFLEKFLKEQFGFSNAQIKKVLTLLSGYYEALAGVRNKQYFFKYFENYREISMLLKAKSKHIRSKYDFFYHYIIEHQLAIKEDDLKITKQDIETQFPSIDSRSYDRILHNLLSKVFDGKLLNEKDVLLKEIKTKLVNF